ncbi:MAG TPA: hypothetical protein PLD48_02490 [Bacillota bacterium]|nr:hypothetical protein [Bacillota bacterium]
MDNAARTKKNYKGSLIKRLIRESLILSCLNKLSDRIFKLFSAGVFYLVFCGCNEADNLLKNGVWGRIASKFKAVRLKRFIASGIEKSFLVNEYRRLVGHLLSASLRTYGIFFCSFGIYSTGIYFAKLYSYIATVPGEDEIIVCALLILAGIPMLFSKRSICGVLKTSRVFRGLFINIFGVNELALRERATPRTYGTAAFIFGTFTGLLAAFVSPALIAAALVFTVISFSILYSPELGVLLSVFLFPLISVRVLATLLAVTTVCYLLKVLRAKRNLVFKTADVFVFFFALYIVAIGLLSGSGGQIRALYLLCFLTSYFLTANLIASEKLFRQAMVSLCAGAGISCALYVLQDLTGANIRYLSDFMADTLAGRSGFGYFLVMLLPLSVALAKVSHNRKTKGALLILSTFTAACVVLTGDKLIITAAYIALSLYILLSSKNILTTLLAVGTVTVVISFAIPIVPFLNDIFSTPNKAYADEGVHKVIQAYFATGVGVGDKALRVAANKIGAAGGTLTVGLFDRLIAEGGVFTLFVFALTVYFILQRALYCIFKLERTSINTIAASFAAVLIMFIALGLFYDVWDDIRMYMLFWLVCGLTTAARNVYGRAVYKREDLTR